ELALTVARFFVAPVLLTLSTNRGLTTVSVAVPVAPVSSFAVIVATPAFSATASPVASIEATDGVSIDHGTPPALIVTGSADPVCVPLPSCPHSFAPQHLTDCPVTAQLWCHQPAVIHVAPVIPATATGVGELAAVPSPSSPLIPSPQQRTVPFCSSAHVCAQPAATPTAFVMPLPGTGA